MLKEILVQISEDETRVALLEDKQLVEIYIERAVHQRLAGNIYKGKVENVLPGMQAAFVDIGLEKNAFLYVEDAIRSRLASEIEGKELPLPQTSICDVLKEGQEIIVQITKEPVGTKGPRVTTHITLPGRFMVLMPTVDYVGISRRIEDEAERERLRSLAEQVKNPAMGLIVRTVAEGVSIEELRYDVTLLTKLWRKIQNRGMNGPVPNLIHKDLELVQRILRDLFSEDIDRLLLNSRYSYEKVLDALEIMGSNLRHKVVLSEKENLFEAFSLEGEIEKALKKRVWLKCGGYIVIDQMEALTSIDVNTGKYVGSTSLADTVLKTNLEAATEIARQMRLRNIGGIIIIDFIDMESQEHQQMVLDELAEELKKDKTKTNILGLTQLGLVEMTRKKVRQSLDSVLQKTCLYCEGTGRVLAEETVSIKAKKMIISLAEHNPDQAILVEAHPSVAALLIGGGGANLRDIEQKIKKQLYIRGVEQLHIEEVKVRSLHSQKEIENLAIPVKPGQVVEVKVEEPHVVNINDGIALFQCFVIDIEGAGAYVGEPLAVEITKVYRTYAKAKILK